MFGSTRYLTAGPSSIFDGAILSTRKQVPLHYASEVALALLGHGAGLRSVFLCFWRCRHRRRAISLDYGKLGVVVLSITWFCAANPT